MNLGWYDCGKKVSNYLGQRRGMGGILLNFAIRSNKANNWDPIIDTIDYHECLMYQVRLKGNEFFRQQDSIHGSQKCNTGGASILMDLFIQ